MYSAKNSLKVWLSNSVAPSIAATLAALPAGEIGFFTALGAAITSNGTGHICYRRPDGQILKSDEVTFAADWHSSIVAYAAPTLEKQTITITGPGTMAAGLFYQIRLEMKLPGMQGEYIKHGNHLTLSASETTSTIATALAASLNANMSREGKSYFTITASTNTVIIETKLLPYVLGKKQGRPAWFRSRLVSPAAYAAAAALTTAGSNGSGYGPYVCEQEFFAQGYSDALRFQGYPNSFDTRALTGLATGRYKLLALTLDNQVKTANTRVDAPQQYLFGWNSIGVGVVPIIAGAVGSTDVINGTGFPGDVITVYIAGTPYATTPTVAGGGTWTVTATGALAAGQVVTATATCPGGGASAASAPYTAT